MATRRLLGDAAKVVDARRSRSVQRKVGASEIGVCRRRAGYSHHGTPVSNPENVTGLAAIAGTWWHKGALQTMRSEWGALIETRVEDETVRGHVDAIELPNDWRIRAGLPEVDDPVEAIVVDDLKTKRDARMVDYVRNRGPKRSDLFQPHIYARLLRDGKVKPIERQAKLAAVGPLPVEVIRLRYMARTGEEDAEFVHEQPYDEELAAEAWEWVAQVAASKRPEDLPRDEPGPGLSVACDHCPFRRECWGEENGHAPQALLLVDDRDLARVLADYDNARTDEQDASARKALARAVLDATRPAIYVDPAEDVAFKLGWSGGRMLDPQIDQDELLRRFQAMQALYREAGLEVPEVPYHEPRPSARSLRVTRWEVPEVACGKPIGPPVPYEPPDAPEGVFWLQDRPRGGWTRTDHEGNESTFTAGQAAKAIPDYEDPRPRCVLGKGHSGGADACKPSMFVTELDTLAAEEDPDAVADAG